MEAEEWIIQIQKAIYSIHCQVKSYTIFTLMAHTLSCSTFPINTFFSDGDAKSQE
jgi:hypothetical protein